MKTPYDYAELIQRLRALSAHELDVLSLRFGLDGGECKNVSDTSKILEVTRERVRIIEARVVRKLRQSPPFIPSTGWSQEGVHRLLQFIWPEQELDGEEVRKG